MKMHGVYLLTGSNLGDRALMLSDALKHIRTKVGEVSLLSSVYETEPWGFRDHRPFLNQVVKVETALSPAEVLSAVLRIELILGRVRQPEKYTSRLIDIDILFYDNLIISQKQLTIPHPLLHERRFTLAPLAEIAPDFIHPVLGDTMTTLLNTCSDTNQVDTVEVGEAYGLAPKYRDGR